MTLQNVRVGDAKVIIRFWRDANAKSHFELIEKERDDSHSPAAADQRDECSLLEAHACADLAKVAGDRRLLISLLLNGWTTPRVLVDTCCSSNLKSRVSIAAKLDPIESLRYE